MSILQYCLSIDPRISVSRWSTNSCSFHGPAPLHHTLLSGSKFAGVTVQTLHPKHFDRGTILYQTPKPGIEHRCSNVPELSRMLAPRGASMLVDCIKNNLYLSSSFTTERDTLENSHNQRSESIRAAPKIKPADRFIDWNSWTAEEILRRNRVIGPLWSLVQLDNRSTKRVIWSGGFEPTLKAPGSDLPFGQPTIQDSSFVSDEVCIRTCDDQLLKIYDITIEGGRQSKPVAAAKRAGLHQPRSPGSQSPLFRNQLVWK